MAVTDAGILVYFFSGLMFAALTIMVVVSSRPGVPIGTLVFATFVTAMWAFLLAGLTYLKLSSPAILFSADVLRDAAWFSLLLRQLSVAGSMQVFKWAKYLVHGTWVTLLGVVWILAYRNELLDVLQAPHVVLTLGPMLLALIGLMLIEQLFRNADREYRWAIKYLCLGLGAVFAYDIYLYANAMLYRNLNIHLLSARGAVAALAALLIGISARRNPVWAPRIFVSRRAVFYSGTLAAVGLYLLVVALGGYYIREFGGGWGSFSRSVFFFGAVLALLVIVLSGRVRARLRVFLAKNFYKNKYEYRDEWLRLIETLDSVEGEQPLPIRAVRAMAEIVESDRGVLWCRNNDRYEPVEAWKMRIPSGPCEPCDSQFITFLKDKAWIVDSREYQRSPSRYKELTLPAWLVESDSETLTVPLLHGRELPGFIVLQRPTGEFVLTYEDIDLLRTVGRQIASYLAQESSTQQLAESRQFEAYNRLTSFIMHDLKNLIAQQSLVVKNAARYKNNPEFIDDAISTIDNSVRRMNHLLQQLYRGETLDQSKRIRLASVLRQVVSETSDRAPLPLLENPDNITGELFADRERLVNMLVHIIRNAQDATPNGGQITVRLQRSDKMAIIEIADTGEGMSEAFIRERLFRPFDSTKGSQGMGIGAYQAHAFVRGAGGSIDVTSSVGTGTTVRISLPMLLSESGAETAEGAGI